MFSEKTILVTGGAGFLGSFVTEELRRRGAQSLVVPRSKEYDLVEQGAARRLLKDASPQLVIHLAARVGGIGANRKNPGRFFYENLMMGAQLIHECWKARVEKVVVVGTICAYPKHTPIPFREADLWDGYPEETNAPYGIAKKALLVQAQAYRQQYGLNAVYLLPVNLYGPRDNFDLETSHVIPALIRKCVEAKDRGDSEVELWGDGTPTREFFHARDAARAIVMALEQYDDPEPVNLGAGKEISIKDLALLIARETGFQGAFRWRTDMPNGQPRRCLDVSRARECFGFTAEVGLTEGIRETVAWWLAHRNDPPV
ncbi:GDP-L-fucose synthase family protein [Planctomycetota bacterium]